MVNEKVVLELSKIEAFTLNSLLWTGISGPMDGPRGILDDISGKLSRMGVGFGQIVVEPQDNIPAVTNGSPTLFITEIGPNPWISS